MSGSQTRLRTLAALITGIVLGAVMSAGTALLLYTGQGFLRAAGLLVSSTIGAVAAGLWAGTPEAHDSLPTRGRWAAAAAALIMGGIFVTFWGTRAPLRGAAAGGAVAVLLVLALPAYMCGVLLAGLHARTRAPSSHGGTVAAAATGGAAAGVLLATTLLIQLLEPYGIYYGGSAILAFTAVLDGRVLSKPTHRGAPEMTGHVTLITGTAHRGQLGFTLARQFLDAGAAVVITARSHAVHDIAAELSAPMLSAVEADLLRDDDVARLLEHVRERHGRLDSLVNVAGGLSVTGRVDATDAEAWSREYERNALTAVRVSRAALPLLRESRGAIINFASPAGQRAVAGLAAYSAAKAAVIAFTRALALEEKSAGVRVNAVAPGMMDTEQNRSETGQDGAFVPRDDVASVVLFLAGPTARSVTGETIHVLGHTIR